MYFMWGSGGYNYGVWLWMDICLDGPGSSGETVPSPAHPHYLIKEET